MTELSPAANAVLTAVTLTKYDVPPEGLPAFAEEIAPLLAAALRAAADQFNSVEAMPGAPFCRNRLLTIANELENIDE